MKRQKMFKKPLYIFILILFITSCSNTFDSIKRGLTGDKGNTTDEFLVKKKDPLILPPDFQSLPTPSERIIAKEDVSNFEKKFENLTEDNSSNASSTEESILKKIQSK